MSISEVSSTIRHCAQSINDAVAQHGADCSELLTALKAPVTRLIQHDNLAEYGAPRPGNNVAMSQYLYFDGQLSILLFEVPTSQPVPPHDHGIWEGFGIYRGRVRHQVYRRVDDMSVDGYAELECKRDEVLCAGDVTLIAPPDDIHSFIALDPSTMGLTITFGPYKEKRHYYQPDNNSYVVKSQNNRR